MSGMVGLDLEGVGELGGDPACLIEEVLSRQKGRRRWSMSGVELFSWPQWPSIGRSSLLPHLIPFTNLRPLHQLASGCLIRLEA